jgi:hypothetical protein
MIFEILHFYSFTFLQFYIFTVSHFYSFILVTDTAVQNNDNEISLHFKPMGLIFITQEK